MAVSGTSRSYDNGALANMPAALTLSSDGGSRTLRSSGCETKIPAIAAGIFQGLVAIADDRVGDISASGDRR
jgi:hypothetical protein